MYARVKVRDTVRVPPDRLEEDLKEVIEDLLWEQFEGRLDAEYGMVIGIESIDNVGEGRIIEGDGGVYFDVHSLTYLELLQNPSDSESPFPDPFSQLSTGFKAKTMRFPAHFGSLQLVFRLGSTFSPYFTYYPFPFTDLFPFRSSNLPVTSHRLLL